MTAKVVISKLFHPKHQKIKRESLQEAIGPTTTFFKKRLSTKFTTS